MLSINLFIVLVLILLVSVLSFTTSSSLSLTRNGKYLQSNNDIILIIFINYMDICITISNIIINIDIIIIKY